MNSPARADVLVVGGGVAGFLAAITARQRGRSVVVATRAGGATGSWSGAVDVACDLVGSTPGPLLPGLARGGAVVDNATRLAAQKPRHPYARFGARPGAPLGSTLASALAALVAASDGVDLVARSDGHNHVLATVIGSVKRAGLVASSQHLDLHDLAREGAVVGVVEWLDLAGFSARPVVELLRFATGLGAAGFGATASPSPALSPLRFEPVVVPRQLTGHDVHRDTRAMARALDDDTVRNRYLGALRDAVAQHPAKPTHLLTPAILGTRPLDRAGLSVVDGVVGRPLRELLALPPSSPGERLVGALRRHAEGLGVQIVDGVVAEPGLDGGRVRRLLVGSSSIDVGAVVLASGRFSAGGLRRDQMARETLFGLPVFTDGRLVDDVFMGTLTGDHVDADHAIFRAGVLVDDALRPLGRDRRVMADNVFAAGSIIEGYDPARDGSGLGVAAWTGYLAGQRASEVDA